MTTINTTNNTKNAVEIRAELQKNGTTVEYIVINDQKVGILGSTGEKDKANAIKAIQTALDASEGNIMLAMTKLMEIATIEEKGIEPDEEIEINGERVILSYTQKTIYDTNGEEIANCSDLPDMPNEAIKAVLVARAEVEIASWN